MKGLQLEAYHLDSGTAAVAPSSLNCCHVPETQRPQRTSEPLAALRAGGDPEIPKHKQH
jgi:hypothetical protein